LPHHLGESAGKDWQRQSYDSLQLLTQLPEDSGFDVCVNIIDAMHSGSTLLAFKPAKFSPVPLQEINNRF
jgi:hypothetical protein